MKHGSINENKKNYANYIMAQSIYALRIEFKRWVRFDRSTGATV